MKRHLVTILVALIASSACAQDAGDAAADTGSEVVARFGEEVITQAELNEKVHTRLIALRQQEYEIKRQQLEQTIFEKLVLQAAEAEGLQQADYINKNVSEQVAEPSDPEIQVVMTQYRSRLNPDDEKAKQQVVTYLKQQQTAKLNQDLRARLFKDANVQILLDPIRYDVAVAEYNPTRGGGEDAVVTLIEYTDFQCPFCSRIQTTLDDILDRYGDNVRHVFKQLPLPMHAQARLGAEASLCAFDQGKFWEMHDWLFVNKNQINREALLQQATALELDPEVFTACLDEEKHAAAVQEDMKEANGMGLTGTPGFLINGRVLKGALPMEEFVKVINDELQRAGVPIPEPEAAAEEAASEEAS